MNNNEELLYSNSFAIERLDEQIARLTPDIEYLSKKEELLGIKGQEYKIYQQKKELLSQLKAKKQEILDANARGESFDKNKKAKERDLDIISLDNKIKEQEKLLRSLQPQNSNHRYTKDAKKLNKEIIKLKNKKGKLEEKQIVLVNSKLSTEIIKKEHQSRKKGNRDSLEQRIIENINRSNQATDYLENFEWSDKKGVKKIAENIVKVGKFTSELVVAGISTLNELRLKRYLANLQKMDGKIEGTVKISKDISNRILRKIQKAYKTAVSRKSR